MTAAEIEAVAQRLIAEGDCTQRLARDPVNEPAVRSWTEALGDANPAYPDLAPPAMVQVWTMPGLHGKRSADDPLAVMTAALDEAGYTSVVATNCDQTYARYLHPGEHMAVRSRLTDVVGPKHTTLGEGWFVTTVSTWTVGAEPVAEMMFRVLKFRPPEPPRDVLRPVVNRDTAFFWEGTAAGELRVQRCGACQALRHPPGPMCPRCGATDPSHVVASGRGAVHSYVVHHHPPVPGRELPFVVALVELEEGVRVLGELLGVDPERVRIGTPVEVVFERIDDELTLPAWRAR